MRVKNSRLSGFSYIKNFCDKIFIVLQVANNEHLRYYIITIGTISSNQRLELSFKKCLWRTNIFKSNIFKARQKSLNSSKFFTLDNFRLYGTLMKEQLYVSFLPLLAYQVNNCSVIYNFFFGHVTVLIVMLHHFGSGNRR